jgi:hypothetical protein
MDRTVILKSRLNDKVETCEQDSSGLGQGCCDHGDGCVDGYDIKKTPGL